MFQVETLMDKRFLTMYIRRAVVTPDGREGGVGWEGWGWVGDGVGGVLRAEISVSECCRHFQRPASWVA